MDDSKKVMLLVKKSLAKISQLEDQLKKANEPIAIVGMACKFPGGVTSPEEFWGKLAAGYDAVTEVPGSRWDINAFYDPDPEIPGKMYTKWGSFIDKVDLFDADFFKISPREATYLDPQYRLLLEVSWQALEDAGIAPSTLFGHSTGVYVGIYNNDYLSLLLASGAQNITHDTIGSGDLSNASGRIAYALGLEGPNMPIDTACSSSLVAVHLASQALRQGECDEALVGGVNLILNPLSTIMMCKAKMLSADGHCKTFDASANGFVRGEGCGVLVLKRLSDAKKNGDRILAVIRSSAVNQDGASIGFMAPSGKAQEALLRKNLSNAELRPSDIQYVEAHGTGTELGDPIEVNALSAVLSEGRDQSNKLHIGSVKTNLGHTESAAGIAGLIKLVLSLQHAKLPPSLHFKTPNPKFDLDVIPATIVNKLTPWNVPEGKKRIGVVSSFALSGINAQLVVEEAPEKEPIEKSKAPWILFLSAKTEEALTTAKENLKNYLKSHAEVDLADVAYTLQAGRDRFEKQFAVQCHDIEGAIKGLSGESEEHNWDMIQIGEKIALPTYPFQRKSYWAEIANIIETKKTLEPRPSELAINNLPYQLETLTVNERFPFLKTYITNIVRSMLGLSGSDPIDDKRGFFDMGLTSLMAVELKNQLQKAIGKNATLTSTVIFDHPSIEKITNHLAKILGIENLSSQKQEVAVSAQLEEPIAVIGMACRFPAGANNTEAFWNLLETGKDGISEIPKDRWDADSFFDADPLAPGKMYTKLCGFLDGDVSLFDADFFHISPREAEYLDPQQRLLLEVSYEALQSAGLDPYGLEGSLTSVCIGISTHDYSDLITQTGNKNLMSPYLATGNMFNAASGRLSYVFGFRGPNFAVDTACSSSLVAINQACETLRNREANLALAGGVNLILSPDLMIAGSKAGMFAKDGHCKTFDAKADGYVRSEGCGIIVLKRLSDAKRDGDIILAMIKGSGINQDGASSGLTVPNGDAQESLIRDVMAKAKIQGNDIDYVEAHGTGTSLGDPIEIRAIAATYGQRDVSHPLKLGSVKSNIGHLEAAAGISGIIKTILALQHEMIPANLHFNKLNPFIELNFPSEIVTKNSIWKRGERPRRAAISAFGFSGTNAHLIIEEGPKLSDEELTNLKERALNQYSFQRKRYWVESLTPVKASELTEIKAERIVLSDELGMALENANDKEMVMTQFLTNYVNDSLKKSEDESVNVEQGFFEMGMDSLIAVDLANKIKKSLGGRCQLSDTLVFDYPSVEKMTQFLLKELGYAVIEEPKDSIEEEVNKMSLDDLLADEEKKGDE